MGARNLYAALAAIMPIWRLAELAAGLTLHVAKTVLVPMDELPDCEVRRLLVQHGVTMVAFQISKCAKYLGVFLGRGGHI